MDDIDISETLHHSHGRHGHSAPSLLEETVQAIAINAIPEKEEEKPFAFNTKTSWLLGALALLGGGAAYASRKKKPTTEVTEDTEDK